MKQNYETNRNNKSLKFSLIKFLILINWSCWLVYNIFEKRDSIKKMSDQYDYLFKIAIIGDSSVGKSSILVRFSDNIFSQNFLPTIGVDFKIKNIQSDGSVIKLQIWDTAGQERFRTITSSYYKGANGIILVYDITNKQSFKNVQSWLYQLEKNGSDKLPLILIGNKSDREDLRKIKTHQGQNLAKFLNISFLQTSAKDSNNIEKVFTTLVKVITQRHPKPKQKIVQTQNNKLKSIQIQSIKQLVKVPNSWTSWC